ncbi:MAG TPA: MFS transporter [Candidatus Ignatzschineria merdigallinarum]|uniref:MFS transporter n=1 Tax=Candidatus Ignatzschineria merdigallinarum TaxID=2838621 RepID=A0A9D1Q7G8_9GAMM|nr:MFS transporter [Candidatus Ignatzschineria merdigallinarum]
MASYLQLLKTPGSKGFVFAGLIARIPVSMTAIGIITMLSELQKSYTLAGGVAALFTLSCAMIAPQISRAVDRYGQSRVLPFATLIALVSILALLAVAYWELPTWLLFIFAITGGFMPSMSAMVRARWTEIYRGKPELQTAYALESVLDELCFIVGPPVSVGLCVALFPQAGPLLAMLFLAIGVTAFVLQKSTEPPIKAQAVIHHSVIRLPVVKLLAILMIFLGIIVGTIDVASVAFAKIQNMPASASMVLSFYAISSCFAGLLFGAVRFSLSLSKMLMIAAIATMISSIPLIFVWDIVSLSTVVFIAGFFFSPTMIIAMSLVEESVPEDQLTEGLTWLISGLGIGVALGAAMAGFVIDEKSISAGFMVALLAAIFVFSMAFWIYKITTKVSAHHHCMNS